MQGVNALAEIASSLPDFIGGASRNDDGGQTSSPLFSGGTPAGHSTRVKLLILRVLTIYPYCSKRD